MYIYICYIYILYTYIYIYIYIYTKNPRYVVFLRATFDTSFAGRPGHRCRAVAQCCRSVSSKNDATNMPGFASFTRASLKNHGIIDDQLVFFDCSRYVKKSGTFKNACVWNAIIVTTWNFVKAYIHWTFPVICGSEAKNLVWIAWWLWNGWITGIVICNGGARCLISSLNTVGVRNPAPLWIVENL